MTRGLTHLWRWIGAKLFLVGFRMQPVGVRRRLCLLMDVGRLWSNENAEIVDRVARRAHLDISIGFHTEVE